MRELTAHELSLVSGGYGECEGDGQESILVCGQNPPPYYPPPYFPPDPPYYPPPPSTGGPNWPSTPDAAHCQDYQALEGSKAIQVMNDDQSKEYGSLIYRNADGTISHSPALGGAGDQISLSIFNQWLTSNGISWSNVLGMVHNHPVNVYGTTSDEAAINRYPSDTDQNGGQGDWSFAQYAVDHGASASQFSLYIRDTAGQTREFAYTDRATYLNLSISQRVNGNSLPGQTQPCG